VVCVVSDQPKDSAKEIELKLRVAPGDLASLRRHAYLADLPCAPSTETLVSVYFDSDDLALRQHGLTLRVRHIGDRRLQTIKGSGGGPDYLERPEWEQPIEGDQPVLNDVAAAFSPVLTDEVRNSLKPVFETRVERIAYRLNGGETDIALAIDQGEIVANGASVPLSEIELELKHGDPGELFKVARSIADIVPVQLDVRSKAERGYDLFENKPVGADKGHDPKLSPDLSTGRAFTLIGRACVRHLLANEPGTELRDAESLHQMRIALRRLRSAISLFSGVVTDRRLEAIKAELKWIGGELAPARDLDAFLTEILKPLRRQHRDDPGLASIGKMLARERLKGYRQAQAPGAHRRTRCSRRAATCRSTSTPRTSSRGGARRSSGGGPRSPTSRPKRCTGCASR
jgi:inorganic triphosphatase YgiF